MWYFEGLLLLWIKCGTLAYYNILFTERMRSRRHRAENCCGLRPTRVVTGGAISCVRQSPTVGQLFTADRALAYTMMMVVARPVAVVMSWASRVLVPVVCRRYISTRRGRGSAAAQYYRLRCIWWFWRQRWEKRGETPKPVGTAATEAPRACGVLLVNIYYTYIKVFAFCRHVCVRIQNIWSFDILQ